MRMKGLVLRSFYQEERRTEQVSNDDATKILSWYQKRFFTSFEMTNKKSPDKKSGL